MNRRQFLTAAAAVPVAAAVVLPATAAPVSGVDMSRLTDNTTWYIKGTDINGQPAAEMVHVYRNGRGIRPIPAAEFRKQLEQGLKQIFEEAYTVGLPDENGVRHPFSEEWASLYDE